MQRLRRRLALSSWAGFVLLAGCDAMQPTNKDIAPAAVTNDLYWQRTRWTLVETNGTGTLGAWTLQADDSRSDQQLLTLAHSENSGHTFNLAIQEGHLYEDVEVSVRVRADSGVEDQGGGVIWRVKDKNNYYICRYNPLEGNFRVYVVRDGQRTELMSAEVATEPGRWYTVQVGMSGDRIVCFLDGKAYLDVRDTTFTQAGRTGVWTKADALVSFAEFNAKPMLNR